MDAWLIALIVIASILTFALLLVLLRKYLTGARYKKNTRINDKVVIVTGANCGLGFENAINLAARGGKVYIACRDKKRAEDALVKIKERSGSQNVHFLPLDLSSMESIRNFVEMFLNLETRLDILVNNAGLYGPPKSFTKEGFEMQMGVNHLGHFYLTHLLLDILKKSAPSRIVVVSSMAESWGKIERDNFNSEKSYNRHKGYANSKLANVLYTRELARRLQGTGVIVNCCHPGAVKTEIQRGSIPIYIYIIAIFVLPFLKTAEQGAQTQVALAIDPDLKNVSGKYFENCKEKKASKRGQDDETAEWLWNKSIEMLKL